MVYCSRCGTKNKDEAEHCIKCGVALYSVGDLKEREETCFGQPDKYVEEECVKVPHIGEIAGIIVGIFIILIGLAIAFKMDILRWIGAFIAIIVGLLIITVVLLSRQR
ncbi:zinc ribbon domain-containing protein [[Eubacterium] cellulosolvens]